MSALPDEGSTGPRRVTNHWTPDGRYHAGPVEACTGCETRPDERQPVEEPVPDE